MPMDLVGRMLYNLMQELAEWSGAISGMYCAWPTHGPGHWEKLKMFHGSGLQYGPPGLFRRVRVGSGAASNDGSKGFHDSDTAVERHFHIASGETPVSRRSFRMFSVESSITRSQEES